MLGHVDSGKTSLARALSSTASTAAFDKNPQSKERGITLDLGFSSFEAKAPKHLSNYEKVQYTLVDCPGHASLIKTIIGGAQIIDLMILVVDVMKGIQTQTAECLVIGELICPKILVVINKIDLLSKQKKQAAIEKMTKKILKTLEKTKFKNSVKVVAVSANPALENGTCKLEGIENLVQVLSDQVYKPKRSSSGNFIFSVDHCFPIAGQGTVLTGTVLQGSVGINDTVEIANLQTTKKVKSIQIFGKSVEKMHQGDRGGMCVTQFDPKKLERGLVCSSGALSTIYAAVVSISKISYFQQPIKTKNKYHVTIGHSTVMGKITLFQPDSCDKSFDIERSYEFVDELNVNATNQFALIEFDKGVICMEESLMIGSRLDADVNTSKCRLAFKAKTLLAIKDRHYKTNFLTKLLIYKNKSREGLVERIHDDYTVICKSLMKKQSNFEIFNNMKVVLSTGEHGFIDGTFGQSGKTKVRIPDGIKSNTKEVLISRKKKNAKNKSSDTPQINDIITVKMLFKRYIYDSEKLMKQ